jgi:hypothetical protein
MQRTTRQGYVQGGPFKRNAFNDPFGQNDAREQTRIIIVSNTNDVSQLLKSLGKKRICFRIILYVH